jgi:hypothetical protein
VETTVAVCENRIYGTLAREKSGLVSTLRAEGKIFLILAVQLFVRFPGVGVSD